MRLMLARAHRNSLIFGLAAALSLPDAHRKDPASARDRPLVKRYEGSEIVWYSQHSFVASRVAHGPVAFDYKGGKMTLYQKLDMEGRKTTIYDSLLADVGPLEVLRNCHNELEENEFEVLFSASGDNFEHNKRVSSASPVATNTTEEGRAKNPRVELVETREPK
jgi:hypothetical protein